MDVYGEYSLRETRLNNGQKYKKASRLFIRINFREKCESLSYIKLDDLSSDIDLRPPFIPKPVRFGLWRSSLELF